jgi:hypothetical protein
MKLEKADKLLEETAKNINCDPEQVVVVLKKFKDESKELEKEIKKYK